MGLLDSVSRVAKPIATRVFNTVARAFVKLVDDTGLLQTVQVEVLDGEIQPDCPRFQQYGFTGHPVVGTAEAIVVFLNGDRSQPYVLAIDDMSYRLTGLQEGEVALYTDEDDPEGDPDDDRFYHLLARGKIHRLKGMGVELCGDDQGVVIDGKLKSYIDSQIRAVFNAHTHVFTLATGPGVTGGTPTPTAGPSASIAAAGDIVSSKAKAAE